MESEHYELDEEEFHASLPKRISATFYFEVESILELSTKVNALIGRLYENESGDSGYSISDIRQIVVLPVTEFYTMPDPGSTNAPIPHMAYHAIVIPVWKQFFPDKQEREEAKIVSE